MNTLPCLPSLACALVGATMVATVPVQAQDKRPNVVFILVDNVGANPFGAYGGPIRTERIDRLAREGMRFNNYYVEAQCASSRSAIHTGRLPVRSGTFRMPLTGEGAAGMAPWEYTIAELLSDAGYATALFGNWHLGDTPGRLPSDQGYDEWWGAISNWDDMAHAEPASFKGTDLSGPVIWEGQRGHASSPVMPLDMSVRPIIDEEYIIPKSIEYIKRNAIAKKPFFLYVAYSQLTTAPARSRVHAAQIEELDYRVGQLLDALKEAGIDDKTIVILSSDDAGSTTAGANLRAPAIVRWPRKIPGGVVTDQMLTAVDWLPTLAGIVGAGERIPRDRPIDGVNAAAFLLGKSKTTGRDGHMIFGMDGELLQTPEPAPMLVAEYHRSLGSYRNIKVGEDFKGYTNQALLQ